MGSLSFPTVKVGIVVLNFNNAEEVVKYLNQIIGYKSLGAIQVIDNCSTDDSYRQIRDCNAVLSCQITHLAQCPQNGGYAKGNNYGVKALSSWCNCRYLLISNPDVIFDDATVKSLADFLDGHPDYAAVAPVMLDASGNTCLSGWKLPTKADFHLLNLRRVFRLMPDPCAYPPRFYEGKRPFDSDVLPGSLFLIRHDVFDDVGGFDEDTFLYGEENLLFAKVKRVGKKCAVLPSVRYVHAHGTSINREFTSVKKRFLILLDSNEVYLRKVLKADRTFIAIYKVLFKLSVSIFAAALVIRDFLLKRSGTDEGNRGNE